jgi:hypothetical protein
VASGRRLVHFAPLRFACAPHMLTHSATPPWITAYHNHASVCTATRCVLYSPTEYVTECGNGLRYIQHTYCDGPTKHCGPQSYS